MFVPGPDPAEEARRDAAFPDGWFAVARSRDLGESAVISRRAFGRNLVLWRTEDGQAHVANTECPHLGADMSLGTIRDGGLVCPIHGLRFGGEGQCLPVRPGKPAPSLLLRSYPVFEKNGIIALWRHVEKAAPEPDIPDFAECGSSDGSNLEAIAAEVELSIDADRLEDAARRAKETGWRLLATPIEIDRTRILLLSPRPQEAGELERGLANLLHETAFSTE